MDLHRRLVERGKGSVDWANEWTEVKYLGGRRFAARIYSKPRVFKYNGKWLKHKLIRKADRTILISANAGVLIKSDGNVALIDPKYRKVRVLREEFAVLALISGRWIPVLTTTKENLVKIESFEESDRIYARITYANEAGELVIEYLLIDGHMLKHNIKFTAKRAGTYRLAQGWLIPVKRVRVAKERLEEHEITGRKELPPKVVVRFVHEGILVTENLARLFEEDVETRELKAKIVKKVILDLDGDRGKVAILYGDWDLGAGEALELDPDTTTISPPTDDTFVYSYSPDYNFGSNTYVSIRDRSDARARIFIRFDLSSIPSGATINLAKIRLYYYEYKVSDPAGKQTDVHRVLGSWDESTATWNNKPDIAPTPTSSTNMPSSYGWVEWTVTDDVQGMVDGSYDNYGWCIKYHDETLTSGYSFAYFYSKEYDGYDPELYVEYTTAIHYTKEFSESISPSDMITRRPSKPVSETVSLSDVKAIMVSATRSELLSLSDILSRVWNIYREHSEALIISDVRQSKAGLVKAEMISLSDIYDRTWSIYRALEEAATLADKVAKLPSIAKAEAISLADAVEALKVYVRALEEVVALTDALIKSVAAEKSDLISLTDIYRRTWNAVRMFGEVLSASDAIVKQPAAIKSEAITLADYVAKLGSKILTESTALLDYYARQWAAYRGLAESVTLSDIVERLKAKFKTLTETISLLDSKLFAIDKTFTESTQLTDKTVKQATKLASETLNLLDSISKQVSILKSELATVSDILQRTWTAHKELAESVSLSDVVERLIVILKVLEEVLTLTDVSERIRVVHTIQRLLGPTRLLKPVRVRKPERVLGHTGE